MVLIENTDLSLLKTDFFGLNPSYFHSLKVSTISPQKQTVKNRSKSTEEVQQAKKVISLQNAIVQNISISFDAHL